MFSFFGREARGILAPQPGMEPAPPALEGEVSTNGPPGKTHHMGSWYAKMNTSFKIFPLYRFIVIWYFKYQFSLLPRLGIIYIMLTRKRIKFTGPIKKEI